MSQSSLLGVPAAEAAGITAADIDTSTDADLLGPSDSTDSGSDRAGTAPQATDPDRLMPIDRPWLPSSVSDSDRSGTGERASADGVDPVPGADILPDRVVSAEEAGISYRHDPLLDEEDDSPLADYADEAERQQDA